MRRPGTNSKQISQQRALLSALSDDLSLPLLQVKSTLELLQQLDHSKVPIADHLSAMSLSAENGLQLIEAYRLVLHSDEFHNLELVPLAIGAILEDVAHQLSPYAKQYNTSVEVDVQGRLAPILVNPHTLGAAFEVLGSSLIRAQAGQTKQSDYRLILGAHKSAQSSIAAGVFSNVAGLSDRTLRSARSLAGQARQPNPSLPIGAASGVLIADLLCTSFWQPLRAAAHKNMSGLVTTIPVSKQLQII